MSVRVQVVVEDELAEWLTVMADEQGRSVSNLAAALLRRSKDRAPVPVALQVSDDRQVVLAGGSGEPGSEGSDPETSGVPQEGTPVPSGATATRERALPKRKLARKEMCEHRLQPSQWCQWCDG